MGLKEHIILESDRLFSRHGIRSITMDDLAAELGMSKKTIYQHFEDKNQLVCTLIRNKLGEQIRLIDQDIAEAENAIDEIFRAIGNVRALFLNMNPTLFYDLQKYHPEAWAIFQKFRNEYLFECIRTNLRSGIKNGYYRNNIDVEILSRLRIEQIDIVFNPEAFPPAKFHLGQVMIAITEHFLYGICTERGFHLITKYKGITEES